MGGGGRFQWEFPFMAVMVTGQTAMDTAEPGFNMGNTITRNRSGKRQKPIILPRSSQN
ncbi:hypothetical protein DSCOOX_44880 [Desulfosarcina ovata subsp. ovata]|uniref:Uncharacterized protein n=1 Tax=Desulfosarcina ovata subsp. ovata TaxID=2752305 RepID=A0A5K8AFM1_9BACT|nr:hypothetical protein DSCOOX_44880 [Desulfosarcina ovata subsp. ovata]